MEQSNSHKNDGEKILWISWERQRRSLSLSRLVNAHTYILESSRPRLVRYLALGVQTLSILLRKRPKVLFVQNPSRILTFLVCLWRPLGRYFLVVDRHSNFYFKTALSPTSAADVDLYPSIRQRGIAAWIIGIIDRYTLRMANLTVVTNKTLADAILKLGGKSLVLQDPFPSLTTYRQSLQATKTDNNVLDVFCICSWAADEPISLVIDTFRKIPNHARLKITGRPKLNILKEIGTLPSNVELTGFLSDSDYFNQMKLSDAVMVLTSRPATLVCGAYEAVALQRPLILSNSYEIREYFDDSAVYVDHNSDSIINAVEEIRIRYQEIIHRTERFFLSAKSAWDLKFDGLRKIYEKHL